MEDFTFTMFGSLVIHIPHFSGLDNIPKSWDVFVVVEGISVGAADRASKIRVKIMKRIHQSLTEALVGRINDFVGFGSEDVGVDCHEKRLTYLVSKVKMKNSFSSFNKLVDIRIAPTFG